MSSDDWQTVLVIALGVNAAIGFGYRVFRLTKGGPMGDVIGQAILGGLLAGMAIALSVGATWTRWIAAGYALLFGLVVMPVWILAVLLPLRPGAIDYAFTATYWVALAVIAVAGLAA